MDLLQSILQAGGGTAVQQMAGVTGLEAGQVESVLGQLVPALAGGLQHNVSNGGLGGLMGALTSGRHQQYAEDPAAVVSPAAIDDGNGILGHIFGSKDVSRQVAAQASAKTGVASDVIKQLLPMVAALAMGAMSQRAGSGGAATTESGLGEALGGLLGGGALGSLTGGSSPLSGHTGGGGVLDMLTPMLDSNRDGSIADDVMGMLGKMMGGR
jgi:hypothetical protein